jgi:hypothetical protein
MTAEICGLLRRSGTSSRFIVVASSGSRRPDSSQARITPRWLITGSKKRRSSSWTWPMVSRRIERDRRSTVAFEPMKVRAMIAPPSSTIVRARLASRL